MSKKNFTKEEIEKIKDVWRHWYKETKGIDFQEYLDSLLKPETKKIIVEIEYEVSKDAIPLTANNLQTHFEIATELKNPKVTELPEVFSREDMIKFKYNLEGNVFDYSALWDHQLNNFLLRKRGNNG